VPFLHR